KEFFIKKTNGEVLVVDYWGGSGSYIDFTDSRAQIWWKDKLKRYLLDFGIEGIWNDNNEYEIFEEHQRSGQELEMILIMSKLAYEASLESGLELPWILSRSGYSGIQKYASSWTGDNYSSWKSQQFDNAILSSCGLSGLVHMGVDIGGFFGPNPDPELFLRWIQNGVFHPRFCIHSYKSIPTEADMYQNTHKEFFEIIQKFMRLRQELIPYIKESAQKANQQGIPIMRPTVYDFQTETETYEQSFEYMFGDKFFVAPIYRSLSEEKEKTFYLPGKNHKWKHYFTGEEFIGGRCHTVKVDFSCIPVFELI
ncbi:MAG: hypothetical protein LW817_04045, partial [Candidatus Caenarcaniphilales bacterium]|nr:hypothetical protein [Candidatus Caenarcaniphilales bacterium]